MKLMMASIDQLGQSCFLLIEKENIDDSGWRIWKTILSI